VSFRQEYLGQVRLSSGRLVVLDPEANWLGIHTDSKRLAFNTDEQGGELEASGGVAFAADNTAAQVFANYDEKGRITSVEIRIIEEE